MQGTPTCAVDGGVAQVGDVPVADLDRRRLERPGDVVDVQATGGARVEAGGAGELVLDEQEVPGDAERGIGQRRLVDWWWTLMAGSTMTEMISGRSTIVVSMIGGVRQRRGVGPACPSG